MDNMSPQYIDAFRPLWWECSVCAKYSEVSGYRLDFEKKVQRSLTLAEMETGEKLVMEEDYLQTTNLSIENSSQWTSDTESDIKDNADFSSVIKKNLFRLVTQIILLQKRRISQKIDCDCKSL